MKDVTCIAICTRSRDELLLLLVSQVLTQVRKIDVAAEIIIVDNNPENHLEGKISSQFLSKEPIKYIHVKEPGVSNARNAALVAARERSANALIFLDDDETIDENWLSAMLRVSQRHPNSMVCGPVIPVLERGLPPSWARSAKLWSRPVFRDESKITHPVGNGNLLLPKEFLSGQAEYPVFFNSGGGEDTFLTTAWLKSGGDIRYAALALAYEKVPQNRCEFGYVIQLLERQARTWARITLTIGPGFWRVLLSLLASFARGTIALISTKHRTCNSLADEIKIRRAPLVGLLKGLRDGAIGNIPARNNSES